MVRVPGRTPRDKRAVIVGCGRLGATIATALADRDYRVFILDVDPAAFDRLPAEKVDADRIVPILADGTLEAGQRQASVRDADLFIAVAGRDTSNALAAQIAKHIFQVPTVICRMNDPVRQRMYADLGLVTISPTQLVTEMVLSAAQA